MVLEDFDFVLSFYFGFMMVIYLFYLLDICHMFMLIFLCILCIYLFIGNLLCINESVLFVLFLMFIDVIFDTFCEAYFWHNLLCECFICEAGLLSIFQWTIPVDD